MPQTIPCPDRFVAFYLPIIGTEAGSDQAKAETVRKWLSLLAAALLLTTALANSAKADAVPSGAMQIESR